MSCIFCRIIKGKPFSQLGNGFEAETEILLSFFWSRNATTGIGQWLLVRLGIVTSLNAQKHTRGGLLIINGNLPNFTCETIKN